MKKYLFSWIRRFNIVQMKYYPKWSTVSMTPLLKSQHFCLFVLFLYTQVHWSTKRAHRTPVVILLAKIYYREKIQGKSSKIRHMFRDRRKPDTSCQGFSPSGVTQDMLISYSNTLCLPETQHLRFFLRAGWSRGHPLPCTYLEDSPKQSKCSA